MPIISNQSNDELEIIRREVQQYVSLKGEASAITDRVDVIKKRLTTFAEQNGTPNEKGSLIFPVDDPVTGTKAIVRQKRISKVFNEEVADHVLKTAGIFEECTKTITVLDEDAVMAAYYQGKLTDEDIDSMFPEKVTWALVLEK
jgi:hypothetical protein